jgi:acyl carrier protein
MADKEIVDRVIQVTARVLALDPETIKPADNFVFDLGAESVQSVELVASFEQEFGIELDEDGALAVETVDGAAEFVAKHLKK